MEVGGREEEEEEGSSLTRFKRGDRKAPFAHL